MQKMIYLYRILRVQDEVLFRIARYEVLFRIARYFDKPVEDVFWYE